MAETPFAIVGSGWRAEFYLRIAAALPDRFRVSGLLSRSDAARASIASRFGVPTAASLDELVAARPAFVVLSTPRDVTFDLLFELAARGVPVLAETPPAPDLPRLRRLREVGESGARVQVAEQYQFQPLHAARLRTIRDGRIGTPMSAYLSVAHGYHGVDLARRYLAMGDAPLSIGARRFRSTIVEGSGRAGPPADSRIVPSEQLVATVEGDGRVAVFDFSEDQYFSWIRSSHLIVRGERGEIADEVMRSLDSRSRPAELPFVRRETGVGGNLEGRHLVGITLGEAWVYENPFAPARLADEEIAVATCLARMVEYLRGGEDVCSLADAAQDAAVALLIDEAAATGRPVALDGHVWRTP